MRTQHFTIRCFSFEFRASSQISDCILLTVARDISIRVLITVIQHAKGLDFTYLDWFVFELKAPVSVSGQLKISITVCCHGDAELKVRVCSLRLVKSTQ